MAHVDIGIVCHAVFRGAESVYGPAHSLFEGVRALGRTAFLLEHSLETAEPSRLSLDGAAPSAAPGSRAWPGILRHTADSRCTRQVVRRHSAGFLVAVDPLCFLHVRLAVGKRVPVVFYGADYAERRFRNPILNGVYQALDRHAARRAAAVWSVSEAIRDLRRRQGVPDSHNVVLPNAPEFDPALPARPEEIRGDLALLANLDAGLDTELVAAAFAAVAAARPDAVLHVVGDGRLRPALAARLAAAGLSGRVRFHGHLPRPEALAVVARCRVALAVYAADCAWHAYRDSVKVRDYAAAGVPVVSTPGHGLCAAIEQAGFGRVAADAPSVAAAALAWLSDPAAAAAARRRALEFAQAHSRGRLLRRALATVDAGGGGARGLTIHNIEVTKAGVGLSGGEVCLLELVKNWSAQHRNLVYTSENGVTLYRQKGLEGPNVEYVTVGRHVVEKRFGIFVSWLYKTRLALRLVRRLDAPERTLIVSHSDFFPSVLFARALKRANPGAVWVAVNHMLAPNPFKGVRYQYARGQFCLPTPAGLYYWLSQRLFFRLQRRADLLVGVNTSYESFFRRQNPNVLFIRCGAEDSGKTLADAGMAVPDKTCDACFIGRFHAQKGVLELVDIVARIVAAGRTGFRCAVIGGPADNALGRRLRRQIRRRGLERHFEILGERTGVEKLAVLAQSRVFLFPSYYESFGIVYLEAISLGVPVFEYDLPCYQDHRQGVVKVPFRDNARMAAAVVGLIGDPARYAQLSAAGRAYAKEFSWARAADAIQARADELFRRPV